MSGFLAGKVWQSALPGTLKPLAACLADFANEADGGGVHPSNEYLQWLLNVSHSTIQRQMVKLKEMKILVAVENAAGGRSKIPIYRLDVNALPKRKTWQELKGRILTFDDGKGFILESKGVQTPEPNKEDPLVDPLVSSTPSKLNKRNGVDPRHKPFQDLIFRCYRHMNHSDPPWDGSEAKQLALLLKAAPQLTEEEFRHWLWNYSQSKDITPSARPRIFLPGISNYGSGPRDVYRRVTAVRRIDDDGPSPGTVLRRQLAEENQRKGFA